MLTKRGFIFGAAATIAVIRTPGLLMPTRDHGLISSQFSLDKINVSAKTRVLKAEYTMEECDTLSKEIEKEIDKEFYNIVRNAIQEEIDKEIIEKIRWTMLNT